MTNNLFSVTETAKILGISPDTLRRVEKRGKISPQRNSANQRLYTRKDITFLREILDRKPAQRTFSIEEAAKIAGVTPHTLRRWEKEGKIKAQRTPGGHRRYTKSQIDKLKERRFETKEKITIEPVNNQNFLFNLQLVGFVAVVSLFILVANFPNYLPHIIPEGGAPSSPFFTQVLSEKGGTYIGDSRLDGSLSVTGYATFEKGAKFGTATLTIDEKGNLETDQKISASTLNVSGSTSVGSLHVAGNKVFDSSGKIPEISTDYFQSLDGRDISNVNAHHLNGVAASSFLRSDDVDTAEAVINFTASPGSSDVNGGPLYINPAASSADYTLLGIAVDGTQKFRVDAEGDIFVAGGLSLFNNSVSDGTIEATKYCTGDGETNCLTDFSSLSTSAAFSDITNGTNTSAAMVVGSGASLTYSGTGTIDATSLNTTSLAYLNGGFVSQGARTGKALAIFNETGDQDIIAASASGSTVFRVTNSGEVRFGTNGRLYESSGNTILRNNGAFGAYLTLSTYADFSSDVIAGKFDNFSGLEFGTSNATGITIGHSSIDTNIRGKLGINNASPVGMLDVSGAVTGKALAIFNETGDQDIFTASASGLTKFVIDHSGQVGIGISSPSYQLQLSTDSAAKPTSNTWTIVSDARLKDNIQNFTDGLSILEQINPVSYELNGLGGMPAGAKGIGVIAQDVKDVIPYTISTFKAKLHPTDTQETELYSFNSSALQFVTINAIKELDTKVSSISAKLNNIELTSSGDVNLTASTNTVNTANSSGEVEGAATESASPTDLSIQVASNSANINSNSSKIDTIETDLALLKNQQLLLSSNTNAATDSSTFFTSLNVLGKSVLSDTVINGKLTVGTLSFDNQEGSIDAIGPLKVQSLALAPIEFQADTIEMDEKGNLKIKQGVIAGNEKIRDKANINPGETTVRVDKTWDSAPASVLLTPSYETSFWVSDISETGFTIHVSKASDAPQSINWWAIW